MDLAAAYRDAMANLGSAVCVVTSAGPAGTVGITATAVCSVSDAPPMLVVCLNRQSAQCAALRENGVLCVNTLAAEQHHLSSVFAGLTRDRGESRFQHASWRNLASGAPALENSLATFDCKIGSVLEAGSHSVFLCEVLDVASVEGDGLVYFRRAYHKLSGNRSDASPERI